MKDKKVTKIDKTAFNKAATHPLQSWEWGEFRKKTGNELVRFDFGQLTLHKIPFTPYKIGAFIKGSKPSKEMLDKLKSFAKKENIIFIKLEPNVTVNCHPERTKGVEGSQSNKILRRAQNDKKKLTNLLRESGAVSGKTLFTPTTFWIDLTKSEENLMKGFSSKTRYNIRLAEKRGVKVSEDNSDKAFEIYLELMRETVERQGFYAHTEKYHRLMWKHLHKDMVKGNKKPIASLLVAKYKREIISTWILLTFHQFLYYPYGASSVKHKNVMANNLMMWEAIRYGKKLGLKTFDLWGREPGKGFTRFKEGYNPQVIEFLGTWDLVVSPLYYPYRFAEILRWTLLHARTKLGFTRPKF